MKKKSACLLLGIASVLGLLTAPVFADLGLAQIAATQGAPAVGQAVLTAAQAVYANNTDPAVIESQLIAILNEAVATGDERVVRYAIVAVMLAGGEANIGLGRSAINNSSAFTAYQTLTAVTVAAVESLMTGGGGGTQGGGGAGGGGTDSGGDPKSLGGGSDPLFANDADLKNLFKEAGFTDTVKPEPPATPE
jgi:hypothetical protein